MYCLHINVVYNIYRDLTWANLLGLYFLTLALIKSIKRLVNKYVAYGAGIVSFLIAYSIGRYQSGIILQWIVAYVLYWIGSKLISSRYKAEKDKNQSRQKKIIVLSCIGFLGLLIPILGFIFALPAFLISKQLITDDYKNKSKLIYFSGAVILICLLNAALGTYLMGN